MCCVSPYDAVSSGHVSCIRLIARECILGDTNSYTLLNATSINPTLSDVFFNHIETILTPAELERYVNINYSALFNATSNIYGVNIVKRLIKAGINIMYVDEYGSTALIRAVWASNINTVKLILETLQDQPDAKKYIDQKNILTHKSALDIALCKNYTLIVDMLKSITLH